MPYILLLMILGSQALIFGLNPVPVLMVTAFIQAAAGYVSTADKKITVVFLRCIAFTLFTAWVFFPALTWLMGNEVVAVIKNAGFPAVAVMMSCITIFVSTKIWAEHKANRAWQLHDQVQGKSIYSFRHMWDRYNEEKKRRRNSQG